MKKNGIGRVNGRNLMFLLLRRKSTIRIESGKPLFLSNTLLKNIRMDHQGSTVLLELVLRVVKKLKS
jgi:uncharacterized protein YjhX (UPF0386 family)